MTGDEVVKTVSFALRDVREAVGLGIPEFSNKSGLPIERIAKIESGEYPVIGLMTLVAYAEAVDLPLAVLADDIITSFEQMTITITEKQEQNDG